MKYYIYDGDTLKYLKIFSLDRERKITHFCLYKAEALYFNSRSQANAARTLMEPEYNRLIVFEMPL